jgi:hypothetical protein
MPLWSPLLLMNVCTPDEVSCSVQDTAGSIVWANDNETLFYVTKDKLDRPYKVRLTGANYVLCNAYIQNSLSEQKRPGDTR